MVAPLYKSNTFWVFRTQLNCPFFCLFALLSITPHLTAQWFDETLLSPSMTHPQTFFNSKCVYFEILNVNKHHIGMEPNSEALEGPTASIWTDFHLIEWAH